MALRNQEIAQRIKELREGKGNPPQPIVAAAVGVSLRTYQNWEGGDAKPEYRNLENLAAYFGVSEEFILTGTENSQPESPVVVSTQMDTGFEEFREHVKDIRRDIAEVARREDTASQEREGIRALLAEQTRILASISGLLEKQDKILSEIQRVVAGMPDDENLRMLNEAAQQLVDIAEAEAAERDAPAEAPADTRRRAAGEP
jgi:transcriptional regulator with XRE-family HTH domain